MFFMFCFLCGTRVSAGGWFTILSEQRVKMSCLAVPALRARAIHETI